MRNSSLAGKDFLKEINGMEIREELKLLAYRRGSFRKIRWK